MANGAIAASFKQLIDHRLNLGNGGEQSICIGVEQLTAQDQILLFVAAGKQAVVPDALKARRQGMQQEAANELFGGDGHAPGFLAIGGTVILVLEGNLIAVQGENPLIGNGNAVSKAAQIFENLWRPSEGSLGVDDPFDFFERFDESAKNRGIGQCGDLAGELELLVLKGWFDGLQQEPPEHCGQNLDWKKEFGLTVKPLGVIVIEATASDYAMDVRMKQQILAPGVEDGEEPDFSAEMLRVGGNDRHGGRAGCKQQLVKQLFVAQGQIVELLGDGEHDVVVVDGQQFALPAFEPFGSGQIPALGAMAVTAGVVGNALMKAVAADLHMPTQRGGPARLDGPHQTQLIVRQGMMCAVPLAVDAEDIGQLDGWPRHDL